MSARVAVVGAGLAGLRCARLLHDAGTEVVVLEKGRGPGGRTSSRRSDHGRFDHGLPALPAGTLPESAAAAWTPRTPDGERLDGLEVAVPAMSAHARALADGLDLRTQATVTGLRTQDGAAHVELDGGEELGPFTRVVVTAPGPQAAALLRAAAPGLASRAAEVGYDPCWTAMAAWDAPLDLGFDAARATDDVTWAIREPSKPERDGQPERWTVQASPAWTEPRLELEREEVAPQLLGLLAALAGRDALPEPVLLQAHRWRYALPRRRIGEEVLREGPFLLAGDWLAEHPRRVPAASALASGAAAAAAVR